MTSAEAVLGEGDWRSLAAAVRRDPVHLPELVLVRVLPLLSPGIHAWAISREGAETTPADRLAWRSVRRATSSARWAGVITGTSFYVGMPTAIATIYFEQLAVILRIAAIFGHDPRSAARAPEMLVIQGRYTSVDEAATAIRFAGTKRGSDTKPAAPSDSPTLVRQALSMIGLRLRIVRRPLDALVLLAEAASLVVPIIGIPVWAYVNARTTRPLGQTAIRYYEEHPPVAGSLGETPSRGPSRRTRRRIVAGVLALGLALATLALLLPLGRLSHALPLAGRGLAELGLLFTVSRLVHVIRPC